MSEINISNYIKSLGLSGAEADAKRAELTALSNAELTQLISGTGKTTSKGTTIETNEEHKEKNITLASGRRIQIKDGKTKYYAADGTELKESYFQQKEGIIDVKNSGRYSVTQAGKTKYYAADGTEIKESYFNQVENSDVQVKTSDGKTHNLNKVLETRINTVTTNLKEAEDENGFIGKAWSGFKNLTGIGDSSDKVREQQEQEVKLLAQFNNNEQTRAKTFKDLTGEEYSQENLEKFIKGEIKLKSESALSGYKEGQEMATDVAADMVSGIAAVGIYAGAVVAAPVTGGASIAIGLAAATASGAAIKTSLKAADAASAGREYSLKDAGHDAATGAFSGVLAPVTGGLGGAVGKTVATKMGIQAVKQVGKEVAAETVEAGVKQGVKSMLTNPTGYEYVGGTLVKRTVAMSAEMATDGAVGGAVDNAFRTAYDGGSVDEILEAGAQGFVGGAIMSPLIGGGMKVVGKAGHELGSKLHNEATDSPDVPKLPEAAKMPEQAKTPEDVDFTARYIDENNPFKTETDNITTKETSAPETPETSKAADVAAKAEDEIQVVKIKPEEFEQKKAEFLETLKNDKDYNKDLKYYIENFEQIADPDELSAKITMYEFTLRNPEKFAHYGIGEALDKVNANNINNMMELYKFFSKESDLDDEYISRIVLNIEDSTPEGIKQLYNALKHDKELLHSEDFLSPLMFTNVSKMEDVPAKLEIYKLFNDKTDDKLNISSLINVTNQENLAFARELVEKGLNPEQVYNILTKLENTKGYSQKCSEEFLRENLDFIKDLDWRMRRGLNETNAEVVKAIAADRYFPQDLKFDVIDSVTKDNAAEILQKVKSGVYHRSKYEIFSEESNGIKDIVYSKLDPDNLAEMKKWYEDNTQDMLRDIRVPKDTSLTDTERKQVQEFIDKYNGSNSKPYLNSQYSEDAKLLEQAKHLIYGIEYVRTQSINDINWVADCLISNNRLDKNLYNHEKIMQNFRDNIAPKLTTKELSTVKNLISMNGGYFGNDEAIKRLNFDYTLLSKRDLLTRLGANLNERSNIISEFLFCSEDEFFKKLDILEKRPYLRGVEARYMNFDEWKRLFDMPEDEFKKMTTPVAQRQPEQVDIAAYREEMEALIKTPLNYNQEDISAALTNVGIRDLLRSSGGGYQPNRTLPFGKLPEKSKVAIEKLPSTTDLMKDLKKNGSVSLKIEDEGGLNPTRAENPVIHPEDIERLDQVENARIKIRYGAKTNWSNTKIARDIMQNFYDGNGHTLEGVDINIVKNNDGTYNVRISGDGHYDYSHLESLGNSTKAGDSSNAGAFGEGTRIVAVNLLAKDTPSVKYACGDWAMTFGRSSNDLQTADMTQTLSKNPETLKGNYIEFQTKNEGLVKEILNSKDYFYHPHNEDFCNLDFENDYFGFKLLPQGEKGNVYIVQRYETDGNVDNGLPGFSLIFKKMPDDEELIKITGSEYKLGTGRDRVQLYNYQIADLIARYAKTMSDTELTQVISSLEDVWRVTKGKKIDKNQLNLVEAFVREARSRSLGIDFNSQKFVWLDKNSTPEDFEMAKLMGYKIADPVMKNVGMSSFESFSNGKKKPLTPTPEQEAKIHLLDEAVKILQENSDINSAKFITKPDTKKPTLIFDQGGCPNEAAEAIISNGEYLGHWVKLPSIEFGDFVHNLATWIHEISHKVGGDTSEAFSNRLIDVQKYITDVMMHNPAALEKMQVLADLYAGKSAKPAQQFDTAAYTTNVQQKLNSPFKYEEYIEEINTPKKEGVTLGRTTVKSFDNNKKLGDMLTKQTPTSLLKTVIHKIRDKKSNLVSQISDAVTNTKPKTFMYEKLPQTTTVTETLTLPATSEYTDKLFNLGEPVRFTIPDTGNMNPTRSEVPAIHPEDVSRLGKTEHARIEIVYGAKTNWSNDKIARDIMQNFYDGNGHTMEGVGIEIIPEADGSYRVRVTGDGHYDYSHLESLGDSTKDGNGANAGAFGEGTRIVAVNLLAKDTPSVKYACGDWTMTFGRSSDDIKTAHMTQTLSKNNTPVKGNYIEFKTTDKDLVKTILDAKDYFKHPYNEDFQNPTFENKYFAFKVDDNKDAKGNLYYIQRYETENGKISGGLKNLSIAFKRTTDDPELRKISGYFNLNSGRDRMAIDNSQLYDLANYYGKTMSDEELTQAIASLEPVLTAKSTDDPKLLFETKDTSIAFARGLIEEARRRGLKIDFSDAKIVYVPDYNWRAGNILDEEIENYLKDNGYRFAYSDCRNVGMKSAQEVYDLEHKPHSLKPTNEEIQKLRILREALDLFAKNDRTGSIPNLNGKQEYVFNAKSSKNTPFHALVKDQKYDGLFIDRKALANADFMSLLSSSIAEMLKVHGNLKSAAYSYQLTDYIRSQLNTFITKPEIAKQLKILGNMYQQIDKK